jgi:hypothetical protein
VLVHVEKLRDFCDRVAPMDFDAADRVSSRHDSPRLFKEGPVSIDMRRSRFWAEFDGLPKANGFDSRLPDRLAQGRPLVRTRVRDFGRAPDTS